MQDKYFVFQSFQRLRFCTEIFFAKLEVLSYVSCLYENNYVNVDAAVDVLS